MRRMAARSMKASRCVSTSAKYGTINASCGNEGLLSAIDDFESSGHARFPGLELTAEKSLRSSWLDHDVVNYAAVDSLTLLVNAFEREKGFEREGKVLTQLGMDLPGVEEALESEHWTHAAFYPPMILFDNIVQVGASADLDRISQLACECRIGVGIQTEASPKRTIPSNDCFLLLFRDLRTLNLKSVSHFCATRSATDATMLHAHLCSTPSAFGRLASAHKCLRICDLCKELAFGTQRELSQVAIHTTRSCSPCYDASSWREVLRKGRSVFSTGDMLILARGAQICNTLIVSTLASCPKLPATVPDLANRPRQLVFLTPVNSQLNDFLNEVHQIARLEPSIVERIDEDLDLHAKKKKLLRLIDAQFLAGQTPDLPKLQLQLRELKVEHIE